MSCILVVAVLVLALLRFRRTGDQVDAMSPSVTKTVNGLFVLSVFFRHIFQYKAFTADGYRMILWADKHLGQLIVVSFLFFSGYGIMEQLGRKGDSYARTIPGKRVAGTWIRFACCVALYLVIHGLRGDAFGTQEILLCLVGWKSAGNSNWYIFVILCLYLLTWAAWRLAGISQNSEDRRRGTVLLHIVLTAILAVVLHYSCEDYWYSTIFVYSAGMFFSLHRDFFERVLWGSTRRWLLFGLADLALWCVCFVLRDYILAYQIAAVLLGFTLVWGLHLIYPNSPVFEWMGRHLFGIYMMQRLPMMLLAAVSIPDSVYLLLCAGLALTLGWGMDVLTEKIAAYTIRKK